MKRTSTRHALVLSAIVASLAACAGREDLRSAIDETRVELSAAQCSYFAIDGKTRICHATGSRTNPFVVLNLAESACVDAHAGHTLDYIATDSTCGGEGCLPAGAPCDATLGCCTGFTCRSGTCEPTDLCRGVTCNDSDQCHAAYCDPATGQCVQEAKDDFPCDDGDACTQGDSCASGVCVGAAVQCLNGGACAGGACSCAGGYSGASCEIPPVIDACAGVVCQNGGSCSGGVCLCVGGYTGAHCETAPVVDACAGVVCQNGGSCSGGACLCVGGFTGAHCETPPVVDACAGVVCQNGGSCSGGVCSCVGGFTGAHCETCPVSPTSGLPQELCSGVCVDTVNDPHNCGGCGTECGTLSCMAGQCKCQNNAQCSEPGLPICEVYSGVCISCGGPGEPSCGENN